MEFEVSKEIESVVVSGNSGFCSLRSRNMNTHKSIEEAVGRLLYMMMRTQCHLEESYNKHRLIPGTTKSNTENTA